MYNIKAARNLLKCYKDITLAELRKGFEDLTTPDYPAFGGEVLNDITGFGTCGSCRLCKEANDILLMRDPFVSKFHASMCNHCIYRLHPDKNYNDGCECEEYYCTGEIYEAMDDATNAEDLYNFIQERIKFLQEAINNYENLYPNDVLNVEHS